MENDWSRVRFRYLLVFLATFCPVTTAFAQTPTILFTNQMRSAVRLYLQPKGGPRSSVRIESGRVVQYTLPLNALYRVLVAPIDENNGNTRKVYDMGNMDLVAIANATRTPVDMQGEFDQWGRRTEVELNTRMINGQAVTYRTLQRFWAPSNFR